MPRWLREYRDKRDATRTSEPMGRDAEASARAPTWRGAFVLHQYDATRMHFDLRLEVGGVLASFAVPHAPSLHPADKHLAVQTEDHAIEYLDFEAVIPEGSYGAGPMIAWDLGAVRYLDASAEHGLVDGKLHRFSLEGRKLRGRFGLVRLKPKGGRKPGREWLLIKKADAHAAVGRDLAKGLPRSVLSGLTVSELADAPRLARRVHERALRLGASPGAVSARGLSPMLCTLAELPVGPGWLYELKLDGVRAIAEKAEGAATLRYRSGRLATASYPEIARAMGRPNHSTVITAHQRLDALIAQNATADCGENPCQRQNGYQRRPSCGKSVLHLPSPCVDRCPCRSNGAKQQRFRPAVSSKTMQVKLADA